MMAKRKLKTFELDNNLIIKLTDNGFYTVEDVLSKPPINLMKILRLSAFETDTLLTKLSSGCLPKCYTAFELSEIKVKNIIIPFGDESLDHILKGGLQGGVLTEIAGPPGVGKTQMCFHLSLQLLKSEFISNSVCYIDTEGSFRAERITEMLRLKLDKEKDVEKILTNLHVFKPTNVSSLFEIFQSLELFCIEKDVTLLVIDSIASLVRKEFSHKSIIERSNVLASWAAKIKALANQLNIAVLVTNQVTSRLKENTPGEGPSKLGTNDTFRNGKVFHIGPALGNTWTHFVNTRLIIQFLEGQDRQLIVAKSPVSPFATKEFSINSEGIKYCEKTCFTYNCVDPNNHQIRVDPGLLWL